MSKSLGINFAQEHLMQIIFQEQVNAVQSKKKGKKKKETLIITDQVLLLDDGTEINYFYWVKLNSIDNNGKEIVVSLKTDKKDVETTIQFSPTKTDIKQVFSLIIDLLQRILLPKKFQKVNKSKFFTEPPQITGQSIISRFLGYYRPEDQIDNENSNIFRLKLMTKNPILKMTDFKLYQNLIPALIHILPFVNFLNYLDFSETDTIIDDLIKNFELIEKINTISFGCKNKSKFSDFLNKLSKDKNIEGLSISSLSLNSEECQNFIDTLKNKKITLLGLHENSLTAKGLITFVSNINSISNLIYLNFNNYSNLDFDSLSSKISFITVLSLVNCNLDLQKAIASICQNDFAKLSELDLSSNVCKSSFNIKQKLPPQLSKLVIGNINWKKSANLFSFLSFIFKKMNSVLKLNLYSSNFDDLNEWKKFYNKLSELDIDLSSVYSFGWDNNPIDSALFTFLEKCTNLTTLSISSFIILNGKEKQLDSLVKYVKNSKNKKIKTFILSSIDPTKSKLKNRIDEILISLAKWKSLKTLDISQNMIGDDGIDSLQNLLSKNPIKLVIFDQSSPSSIKKLVDFFNAIPNGCKVNFPSEDIIEFLNSKKSSINGIQELINSSSKMIDDKNNNIINLKTDLAPNPPKNKKLLKKPDKSPLDQQFFVFANYEYKSDLFIPQYIKSDQYKPLEVKDKKPQKKESDSDESEENSKKKKTNKKGKKEESESESDDYDNTKKKKTTKKGKKESETESDDEDDDDYSQKKKKKKGTKKETNKTKKKQQESSEDDEDSDDSDDSEYDYKLKKKKKINDIQIGRYEMQTMWPSSNNRKSSPKSLTGNNRNNKSRVSLYEMQTKVSHHSYLGKGKEKEIFKRKKPNKFDDIDDEISSSSNDEIERRNKKTNKKQMPPPKIIDIDESSEDLSENSFENELNASKKKLSKKRVQQRAPPPLDGSDDDDGYGNDYDNDGYDRRNRRKFKSKNSIRNDDDDDEDINLSPKPPDWSFPLVFVPPPDDSKEIVDDLIEQYSVGNLLRCVNQS